MQVDPVKPKLKAPGTKPLKLEYDGLLSNIGFKFNLRRYSVACSESGKIFSASYDKCVCVYDSERQGLTFVPNRPISVHSFLRRALTLCPQLCMGIQPGARFPARSADALPATLYGHFTQAIYQTRPIQLKLSSSVHRVIRLSS